jgi:uncharacterized membrane protein YbhN (UPF0104 family)
MEKRADETAHKSRLKNSAFLVLKFTVTAACLWYVLHQVDIAAVVRIANTLNFTWIALVLLLLMLQLPLAGLRWSGVVEALSSGRPHTPRGPLFAITAIGIFFGQIVPNLAGEAMRVWLLSRLGHSWVRGMTSVVIDRGVGVFILVVLGFIILLFPSAYTALGGYRTRVTAIFGAALVVGLLGLLFVPILSPMLQSWRGTRSLGQFLSAVHAIFLRSWAGVPILSYAVAIHLLTILAIWSLARAQGLTLPLLEAAVLFTIIVAMSLVPISVSGWGLREVAVTGLLTNHGIAVEQALFFSVCFGLLSMLASLPGAVVWAVYVPEPIRKAL